MLREVKSVDDVLAIRGQLASVTSLRMEDETLADNFIGANIIYVCHILGMDLNPAQQADAIDEIGQVGWLTMADFKLFLDQMKRHKFYRKDYQELLQEFWKYCDERLDRAFEIETAKVDKTDDFTQRSGTTTKLKDIEVMKIKAGRHESGI